MELREMEDDGWVNIRDRLPEPNLRVELTRVIYKVEWVSTGVYRDSIKNWNIKYAKGMDFGNTKPTHWRLLEI